MTYMSHDTGSQVKLHYNVFIITLTYFRLIPILSNLGLRTSSLVMKSLAGSDISSYPSSGSGSGKSNSPSVTFWNVSPSLSPRKGEQPVSLLDEQKLLD